MPRRRPGQPRNGTRPRLFRPPWPFQVPADTGLVLFQHCLRGEAGRSGGADLALRTHVVGLEEEACPPAPGLQRSGQAAREVRGG